MRTSGVKQNPVHAREQRNVYESLRSERSASGMSRHLVRKSRRLELDRHECKRSLHQQLPVKLWTDYVASLFPLPHL